MMMAGIPANELIPAYAHNPSSIMRVPEAFFQGPSPISTGMFRFGDIPVPTGGMETSGAPRL
jgi:hypothetical protein